MSKNHLIIRNGMVSLMAPSASCFCLVHDINMPLKCYTCQLVHVHIRYIYVSIHASYEPTAINNVNMNSDIHTFDITGICLPRKMHGSLYIHAPVY